MRQNITTNLIAENMEPMFVKKIIDNTAFLQQLFNKLKPTIEVASRKNI